MKKITTLWGLCLLSLWGSAALAQTASLPELVQIALNRAPQIREAQANWQAAQQDVAQSQGALWPKLELNANSAAAKVDSSTAHALTGRLGATVSYNLWDFGRIRSQIEARESQANALADKFKLARETTANDTVNTYLQLVKQQRSIRVYQQHIIELTALVNKLSEIVEVFAGRRSELTQAQTRLGQAEDALVALQARQREYQLVLMRLVGSDVGAALGAGALPAFPKADAALLVSQANQNHPSLRAALHEAAAAQAQLAEAQAAQKPEVDVVLSKQSGRDVYGVAAPAQLYVTARWVAFDGHSSAANQLALLARAQAAQERAETLRQELDYKIQSAGADAQAQAKRALSLMGLVASTDQVRKDYYDQWRELGRRSLLDVLSAESEHLSTRINLVNSEVDQQVALARMRFEAGQLADWLLENATTRAAEPLAH